ncbi:MAG TPA: replicative DNA helicase [Spirochaetota bacterium]|nr:replicative DNA helicase [Spirochaetota bacterium]OPZ37058.1 MAG: Replicative DNA helicase [Spirochaetes bacterium ADurb.BinA120]HNU90955.1 replicative DNA helicase [Spirochaetota bacterium]HPV97306.1 replicative DNA helicase [Spirochaetota bacterium]
MAIELVPPQDIEAEASCLSSALLSRDALLKVIEILQPEDFYLDSHREIFGVIVELERKNLPIDLVTVKQRLNDLGRFERIGGDHALVDIYRTVSTSANAEFYARRIKEMSLRRRLIEVSHEVMEKCHDTSRDTYELMDEVERDVFRVTEKRITSDFKNISDVIQDTMDTIGRMYETKSVVTGVATGFTGLDEMLSGLHESELVIIAGRPSMGKTALALNMANHIVMKEKMPVLFFSVEMPASQLGMRLLCVDAMIDSQRVRTGHISSEELRRLMQSAGRLEKSPLLIDDTPAINIFEIRAKARRVAQKQRLGAIVVDYLQLITSMSRIDRHLQIAEISRSLKQIARELSVPVVALSQLSRAVESRTDQRPQLSDLRESGAIEQDADVVMFIYREERVKKETEKKGIAEVIVAKQRNGPIGEVELRFWEKYTKFGNLDKVHGFDETVAEA